jgi:uncharacterized membrane protein YidH (DUF202 family)
MTVHDRVDAVDRLISETRGLATSVYESSVFTPESTLARAVLVLCDAIEGDRRVRQAQERTALCRTRLALTDLAFLEEELVSSPTAAKRRLNHAVTCCADAIEALCIPARSPRERQEETMRLLEQWAAEAQ